MAESRTIRNLLRRWIDLDSEEVFVAVIGRTGDSTLLLDNVGLVVVLPVGDGDFMVVVMVVDKGVVDWHATVRTLPSACWCFPWSWIAV
jgi:hypothetical protein